MHKLHGSTDYFVAGEGFVSASMEAREDGPAASLENEAAAAPETPPKLRFGWMFKDIEPFRPSDDKLVDLGQAMLNSPDFGDHPSLPAGYTYLAQFIAHDISFDKNNNIPEAAARLRDIVQLRTPSLDLDSVYGKGPKSPEDGRLYEDNTKFKIGKTNKSVLSDAFRKYSNDLFRDNPDNPQEALIADPRNDDNLALAQTLVAFLKFHNNVVDRLREDGFNDDALFEEARQKVVQHYQWIVLKDFLPKIVDESVLKEAVDAKDSPRYFNINEREGPFMPIEFSLAAFRLGHSMIRDSYEWNRIFQSPTRGELHIALLDDLILQTGLRGVLGASSKLPSHWIIDWTRFYDFTGHNGIANNPKFNLAKKIDTTLASSLKRFQLPHIIEPKFRSLAVADLIRGSRMGLPTGQKIAEELKLPVLRPGDIADGPHKEVLKLHKFDKETPLWYYILKEAELYRGGKRLGPVGSFIVAETLVHLIQTSRISIFKKPGWKPDLGQIEPDKFGITDLLVFANVVNPLGS